jgi:hypothetical protein
MGYDEFHADCEQVMRACLTAKLSVDGLAEQVDRLSGLLEAMTLADRNRAELDLADLQEILDAARQTPYASTAAFTEASRIFGLANAEHGTMAERLGRARDGVAEIRAIADRTADQQERSAILELTEPLAMLVDALQAAAPGR